MRWQNSGPHRILILIQELANVVPYSAKGPGMCDEDPEMGGLSWVIWEDPYEREAGWPVRERLGDDAAAGFEWDLLC